MNAQTITPQLFDTEIEQALIGACLADEMVAREAECLCDADDFMDPMHQRVWNAISVLRARGTPATALTLGAHMAADAGLNEVGARAYLTSLSQSAPVMPNFRDYARIITDLAQRRRLDAELEAARERLYAVHIPISECLQDVLAAAGMASDRDARDAGYLPMPDAVDQMLLEAENAVNGVLPPSIKTGLKDLDALTGGFQGGDMVVVAGRPGQGKTVMLGTMARAAAEDGAPVILFELEMVRKSILHRLIADIDYDIRGRQSPLAYSRMRAGKFWTGEFDRMVEASHRLRALPIEIFDTPGMTIHQIESHAARFADRSRRMGLIAIDYLQIVQAGDRYAGSKVAEMTEVSNAVKRMAKRIGWPVAIGCQLNRGLENRPEKDRRPQLSDLRETGAIEQDADIVIGMHRPGYYVQRKKPEKGPADPGWMAWLSDMELVKHDLELSIPKNRSGPDGIIKCFVDIGASAIRDAA